MTFSLLKVLSSTFKFDTLLGQFRSCYMGMVTIQDMLYDPSRTFSVIARHLRELSFPALHNYHVLLRYTIFASVFQFILPLLIIASIYALICRYLRVRTRRSTQRIVITESALYWLKEATITFTFRNLLKHCALWMLPHSQQTQNWVPGSIITRDRGLEDTIIIYWTSGIVKHTFP